MWEEVGGRRRREEKEERGEAQPMSGVVEVPESGQDSTSSPCPQQLKTRVKEPQSPSVLCHLHSNPHSLGNGRMGPVGQSQLSGKSATG